MGSYLRTNYRISGRELDINAVGGGVLLGSWGLAGTGPGTRREHGGFIMGSASTYSVNPTISAYGAMSEYYGDGLFDSGYKIFPVAGFQMGSATGFFLQWSISATATDNSNVYFKTLYLSDASVLTGVSGSDVNFVWAGFIVSSP